MPAIFIIGGSVIIGEICAYHWGYIDGYQAGVKKGIAKANTANLIKLASCF